MKYIFNLLLFIGIVITLTNCTQSQSYTLVVGTYTNNGSKGIYTYRFNPVTLQVEALGITEVASPSFLTLTPDLKQLYAVSELDNGAGVSAFLFNKDTGVLTPNGTSLTKASGPCHVTYTGDQVITANYSSGSISTFPLNEDGTLQEADLLVFNGGGPDSIRQEMAHLHSTQVTPDGKCLLAIDLGSDCIYRFEMNGKKVITPNYTKIDLPAGCGPRHFDFSKDGKYIYLINELGGNIYVIAYNDGELNIIQDIEADPLHVKGSADIHVSPNGQYLYASNRLEGDGIAIFKIDTTNGTLKQIGYQYTGKHPRHFSLTKDGAFMFVACRDDNTVQIFRIDQHSGLLTDSGQAINVSSPVCVKIAE